MIHQDLEEVYQYLTNFLTEERLQKIEYFSAQSSDFILPIMEDVYQFRNAAAIVRSAEACGLHRIVALEKIKCLSANLDLTKGADTWVEIVKHPAHIDSIKNIKQQGYKNRRCLAREKTPHSSPTLILRNLSPSPLGRNGKA